MALPAAFSQIDRFRFLQEVRRVAPVLACHCDLSHLHDSFVLFGPVEESSQGTCWVRCCPRWVSWSSDDRTGRAAAESCGTSVHLSAFFLDLAALLPDMQNDARQVRHRVM